MKKLILAVLLLGAFTFGFSQSNYYDDYRRSITELNWETVAANLLLTPLQKDQLYALNNLYPDYNSWNKVYSGNPDRWREDRYTEMHRILGEDKYTQFKNEYYKGQNPVAVYNRSKNDDMRYKHLTNKNAKMKHKATKAKSKTKKYKK